MDECLPRPNNQPPISIRKSAFGRTNLFLTTSSASFREIKCSSTTMTRQASASIYHVHNLNERVEESKQIPNNKIACWHCCHTFDSNGFKLPRSYDPSEHVYHVYGWFCSANCCKAYILEHSTFDRGYQMNVFVRMLREVYGIESGVIESPPRISLKMFGGPFDIEDFRKQQNVCFIVHPPFVSYCMLIEERQPIQSIGESSQKKGTVKGLRRPECGSVKPTADEICVPNNSEGLYQTFLSKHTGATSKTPEENENKKQKKEKGGLGRFSV